jgi:hypothetical protein
MRADGADRAAVGPAAQQEQQQEPRDQRLVERRRARIARGAGVHQRRRARPARERREGRDHGECGEARVPQAAALGRGERRLGRRADVRQRLAIRPRGAQPRLDHALGHRPGDREQQHAEAGGEPPVAERVQWRLRRQQPRGALGDAEQQRVELARQ